MICSDPWKTWVLPRTCRKSPGSNRRARLSDGVPEACADGARLVAELEVEIEIPLAIGSKLFVGDQKRLVDRIAIDELINVAAGHAGNRFAQAGSAGLEPGTASGWAIDSRNAPAPGSSEAAGLARERAQPLSNDPRANAAGPTMAPPQEFAQRSASRRSMHADQLAARRIRELPGVGRAHDAGGRQELGLGTDDVDQLEVVRSAS